MMDRTTILPNSCLGAIKNLPDSVLSSNGNMDRRFAIPYTGSGRVDPEFNASIKFDLTHNLNSLISTIEEEAKFSVQDQFGEPESWTAIPVQDRMAAIVSLITGRVFVGLPLSRQQRWRAIMQDHTMSVVKFAFKLKFLPLSLRPLVAPLISDLYTAKRTGKEIASLLKNLIDVKLASRPVLSEKAAVDPNPDSATHDEETGRLLSWLIKRYQSTRGPSFDRKLLGRDHCTLSFAAAGFPGIMLTHAVLDLAARQELLAPLRDEIEREVQASPDGALDAKALARLTLLDSFLKESSRMNPPGISAKLLF
jgi:cytochrome P450